MKRIIFYMIVFFPMSVFATENCSTTSGEETVQEQLEIKTDVPSHLKGKQLCVKDGEKLSCVPAEKFKLVPREQQFIVSKTKQTNVTLCSAERNKNRISALAGYGATGHLDRSGDSNEMAVESSRGALGGAMYQRLLTEHWSLGAQVQGNDFTQKNKTALGVLGYEF